MLESNCYDILCKKRGFSPGLGVFAACSPHITRQNVSLVLSLMAYAKTEKLSYMQKKKVCVHKELKYVLFVYPDQHGIEHTCTNIKLLPIYHFI